MGEGKSLLDVAFLSRLEKLDFLARKVLAGEVRGERRTSRAGMGTLFRDHKSYAQGDDLRFLDWNVYSRFDELFIKQFEAEENLDLLLIMDVSGSMDFGRANKMSAARRIAAALGFIALERFGSVEVLPLPQTDSSRGRLRFRGRSALRGFLAGLDALRPAGTFEAHSRRLAKQLRRKGRGLALAISDFFDPEGYEGLFGLLKHLGYRTGAIQILDERDLHPGITGLLRMEDVEGAKSLRRDVRKEDLDRYELAAQQLCRQFRRACRSAGVVHVRIDSAWGLEQAVQKILLGGGLIA
ncbi:MAG TPA: DUF58 domain-containing protein [Planctomycetes bacterium]|nr:DUF58 domain-containing protein [Planctomycetota bacterium]